MTERGHLDAELVPEPFLLPLPCLLLGSLHETEIHVRLQRVDVMFLNCLSGQRQRITPRPRTARSLLRFLLITKGLGELKLP
ncbi:MAG: hypothetical protein QOJ42_7551 [Acidobacteriaceae bacterium]|nr:hypothetical protein [Acidobacteriaceae bacterium]